MSSNCTNAIVSQYTKKEVVQFVHKCSPNVYRTEDFLIQLSCQLPGFNTIKCIFYMDLLMYVVSYGAVNVKNDL